MRFKLLITLFFTTFAVSTLQAKSEAESLSKKRWYRVDTPHFSIVTDSRKSTALKTAKYLEQFRQTFQMLTGTELQSPTRRIKLFATRKTKTYSILADSEVLNKTGGFFHDSTSGCFSLVNLGSQGFNFGILFHEYTHYLHAQSRIANSPGWFREGIAQYLGTTDFRDKGEIHLGKPKIGHLRFLDATKWLSLRELLSISYVPFTEKNKVRKFYAQSWLLVHYLWTHEARIRQGEKFLQLISDGVSIDEAIPSAFNVTLEELEEALKEYARKWTFRYSKFDFDISVEKGDFTAERLTRDAAAFEIGYFLTRHPGGYKKASSYFEHALSINPDSADALAGLASILSYNDFEKAKSYIEKAKSIDPDSPWVATISGHINSTLYRSETQESQKVLRWNAAIRDYNIAIRDEDHGLVALASVANLYASKKQWEIYDRIVGAAMQLAPSNSTVRRQAIIANVMNGRKDSADFIAELVMSSTHATDESLKYFERWYSELLSENELE